jgi:hypothetical protein
MARDSSARLKLVFEHLCSGGGISAERINGFFPEWGFDNSYFMPLSEILHNDSQKRTNAAALLGLFNPFLFDFDTERFMSFVEWASNSKYMH